MTTFDPITKNAAKTTATPAQAPKVWGLVLARAGSVRLPGKALQPLAGQPMAYYTLNAALKAQSLSQTYVYSDVDALNQQAEALGLSLSPKPRPAEVSQSHTSTFETVANFLSQFPAAAWPEALVLLQVTSPLRLSEDIDGAVELFFEYQRANQPCDWVISTHTPLKPPHWTLKQAENGMLEQVLQPAGPYHFPNGAVYVFKPHLVFETQDPWQAKPDGSLWAIRPYTMPWERSLDVDYPVDIALAEWLLAQQAQSSQQPSPIRPNLQPALSLNPGGGGEIQQSLLIRY